MVGLNTDDASILADEVMNDMRCDGGFRAMLELENRGDTVLTLYELHVLDGYIQRGDGSIPWAGDVSERVEPKVIRAGPQDIHDNATDSKRKGELVHASLYDKEEGRDGRSFFESFRRHLRDFIKFTSPPMACVEKRKKRKSRGPSRVVTRDTHHQFKSV